MRSAPRCRHNHLQARTSRCTAVAIASCVALLTGACTEPPAGPIPRALPETAALAKSDRGVQIAFMTDRTGDYEIFGMRTNGASQVNLSNDPYGLVGDVLNLGADLDPAWSPDGSRIVFWATRIYGEPSAIYVMNADGSGQVRLTNAGVDDRYPTWSPDGSRIAFVRSIDLLDDEIFVMNADGSNAVNVSRMPGRDLSPVWSPDGAKLLFRGSADGNSDIWVVNADGIAPPTNLTNDPDGSDFYQVWSPDGSRIAFVSSRSDPVNGDQDVWVMNANGANPTRLTTAIGDDFAPAWSPDGSQIAFTSYRAGDAEIFVMNPDGSGQMNLTRNPASDHTARWSPDGKKIGFVSGRSGNPDIWVMNANGSKATNLTNDPGYDGQFAWRP